MGDAYTHWIHEVERLRARRTTIPVCAAEYKRGRKYCLLSLDFWKT